VEAEVRVDLLSKGTGQCEKVTVNVGDQVEQGQVLAELERRELDAQSRQTRVGVQQAKTAFEIADRSFNEGIGASAERDNARFSYEQSKAALELIDIQIANQTLRAPINGIVTRKMVQEGMVVTAGMPVVSIVDPSSYVLPIEVPEKELGRLKEGQEAQVSIDAFPDRIFSARVIRIDPSINPLSGTVRMLLSFADADKPLLRESAFARVKLAMETKGDVLLVPRDAVLEEEGRKYLFRLEKEDESQYEPDQLEGLRGSELFVVKRVDITIGLEQSDAIEVLEGVEADHLIVIMGHHSLKDGAFVILTDMEKELAYRATLTLEEALIAAKKAKDLTVGSGQDGRSSVSTAI
jgi:RND family efflux transporter MFP subunit